VAKQHILVPNSNTWILHRKGVFYAGQLSGVAPPVKLSESDVVLLSTFLNGGVPETIIQKLQFGKARTFLPSAPSLPSILTRIDQLHKSQVLINGKRTHEYRSSQAIILASCEDTPEIGSAVRLRLSSNFALKFTPAGFQVWCPSSRKNYLLCLELVLLLMSFSEGKTVSEAITEKSRVADEASRMRGISWLFNAGLLVKTNMLNPVDTKQQPAKLRQKNTARQTDTNKTNKPRWQDMKPDGRIPVYFAPHMRNHYPLALGMIYSFIMAYKNCALLEKYQLLPISYMTPNELLGPYNKFGKGVWLFSNYMWSVDINLQISKTLKTYHKGNLTIHGGPSTPSYQQSCADFMGKNRSVDIAVHGEGEVTAAEILEFLFKAENGDIVYDKTGLEKVDGLTFRDIRAESEKLIRTKGRSRLKELDVIPSPYLEGVFDLYDAAVDAAIIESNRGCPFGCTFCDWGSATKQKVQKFDLERVKQEVDWIGRNSVRVLWIADANFGMYDRDIELSEWICETKAKYGFPREVVVNYTKNTTQRLAEIVKVFKAGEIISQGIISIQTTDEATLNVINRRNIKTEKYDELTRIFADEGLPLSTDLMIGLPGITVETFDRDLQRCIDVDVTAKAYPTQLLPNSPMADPEYIKKYKIEVDEKNFLISSYSYTTTDLESMKAIYSVYVVADGYSTLRYVLRYLQWEYNIQAMTFLHKLSDEIKHFPSRYPSITWAMKFFVTDKCMPGGWKNFYDEIASFVNETYGIHQNSAFNTVLYVNELVMPDDAVTYPLTVQLDHDFVAYFLDHNKKSVCEAKRLDNYRGGSFTVDDPDSLAYIDVNSSQYDSHQYFWELQSQIARIQSVSGAQGMKRAEATC